MTLRWTGNKLANPVDGSWREVAHFRARCTDGTVLNFDGVGDYVWGNAQGVHLKTSDQLRLEQQIHSKENDLARANQLLDQALADWKAEREKLLREQTAFNDGYVDLKYNYDRQSQELKGCLLAVVDRDIEIRSLKTKVDELEKTPSLSDKERNAFHDVITALTKERDGWRKEALESRKKHEELWKTDRARDIVLRDQANFREERDVALAKATEIKRRVLVALTSEAVNDHERKVRKKIFDELWPQLELEPVR